MSTEKTESVGVSGRIVDVNEGSELTESEAAATGAVTEANRPLVATPFKRQPLPWKSYSYARDRILFSEDDAVRGLMQQVQAGGVDPFIHHQIGVQHRDDVRAKTILDAFTAEFAADLTLMEDSFMTDADNVEVFGASRELEFEISSEEQLTEENLKKYNYQMLGRLDRHRTYIGAQAFIRFEIDEIRHLVRADTYTTDRALYKRLLRFMAQFQVGPTVRTRTGSSVNVIVQSQSGLKLSSVGFDGEPLERGNYQEDFLQAYDRIVSDLKTLKPTGRIAVFRGPPGTGKTWSLRGLLYEVTEVTYINVSPHMVPQLATPGFVELLMGLKKKKKTMVLIVEDADEVLADRGEGNMSAIAAVLNLSDGLLGALLDLRIVATTNAHKAELDRAVMRAGRLSAVAEVGKLSPERATEAYKRITGGKGERIFREEISLADVYRQVGEDGLEPEKRMKLQNTDKDSMGFATDDEDSEDSYGTDEEGEN